MSNQETDELNIKQEAWGDHSERPGKEGAGVESSGVAWRTSETRQPGFLPVSLPLVWFYLDFNGVPCEVMCLACSESGCPQP